MLSARLRIVSPDAGAIASSLMPEAGRELSRTTVGISRSGDEVLVSIDAKDTTAMRAALNSYLGCVRITEDISKITKVKQ